MNLLAIIAVSVGLAMDAFTVSVAKGVALKKVSLAQAIKVTAFFGGFQAIMPLIGWFLGEQLSTYIYQFADGIAFFLLGILGGKMIYEALKVEEDEEKEEVDPLNNRALTVLAIATSIDALLVGLTISLLDVPILFAASLIGAITGMICFFGVFLGSKIGNWFGRYAEIAGGLMLVLIGAFIFFDGM